MHPTPHLKTLFAVAALLAMSAGASHAAEYDVAGGKLSIKGSVFGGAVYRTDSTNPEIVQTANAATVGITTPVATGGNNQDDGNLNYRKGDAVSRALKGGLEVGYQQSGYGVVGSLKAWYDEAQTSDAVRFGNSPNGYVANTPLSDKGFSARDQFTNGVLDDLYLMGHTPVGGSAVDWKAGLQKLDWGTKYTIPGGLGELSPRDVPAARRAGALPEEGRIPVPALSAKWAIGSGTTLDAFVQTGFRGTEIPGCGTFFSNSDFAAPGCNRAVLGAKTDGVALSTTGNYIKRAADVTPSGTTQLGLGLRQKVQSLGEFGAYLAQYDSRTPYISGIKSNRTATPATPFIPKDPGGLNPQYFMSYPEAIQVLGLTFEKKLEIGAISAELTYRPNQPYQYNTVDMLSALTSPVAPTPLRAQAASTAAGAVFNGYERHKAVQLNISAAHGLPGVLGAANGMAGFEFAYKAVPDLPNPSVMRFRRSDVYGSAPVGSAACPATATAKACSTDGYVSSSAVAYRLRAGLRYPGLLSGVDFTPSLTFGSDVKGWSEDGAINEGRQFAILSLKAEYLKAWVAELAWNPTWGGAYNNLKDRSNASVSLGYRF